MSPLHKQFMWCTLVHMWLLLVLLQISITALEVCVCVCVYELWVWMFVGMYVQQCPEANNNNLIMVFCLLCNCPTSEYDY